MEALDGPDAQASDLAPCAVAPTDSFSGTASRANDNGYPDQVTASVTWTRTGTSGCVDTYVPSGSAAYAYAIPGALCTQSVAPASQSIAAGDGTLTIDRATDPPSYVAHGTTTWSVTWTCVEDNGTSNTQTLDAGGVWLDATGSLDGTIVGSYGKDDAAHCGPPNGVAPCTYAWRFTP